MTEHYTRNTFSAAADQSIANARLLAQIKLDLDSEYEEWKRKLGGKVTWGQRIGFYRDRLILEIYEKRRGLR